MTRPPAEQWTITQVAAFMGLNYQTARNQMLNGTFGRSAYDAKTRALTVSSVKVRAEKRKRDLAAHTKTPHENPTPSS